MNQQYFEHDEEIEMAHPNYLGIRNRFFLFMTYLKNSQFSSLPFSIFTLFCNLILNIIFSVYPVIPFITKDGLNGSVFSSFQLIFSPPEFWLLISLIIITLTIATFILCLIFPSLTIRLHWILNPQFHLIILPFLSLFFGFCPFGVLNYVDFNVFFDIIMLLLLILFPFYLIITSVIFCFDTNSITKPNPVFAEWFYGSSFFFPILNCIETASNSILTHVPRVYVYVLSSVSLLLHLIYLIHIFYKMPFILTIVNQFVATNSLFIVIMNLALILINAIGSLVKVALVNDWVISLIPVIYPFLFSIIYILSEKRRNSLHSFLHQQFDASVREFTVDAIRMTLASYHSEQSIQWIIRDCFLSANKNILSQSFLQYCLELYPKSQWLISIVSFLYSILWSNNPNLYRVLLHWLSLSDNFSNLSAYVVFQCVYCLMQSSKDVISPIIKRDIQAYRKLLASYAQRHSQFWSSAANCDFKNFVKSISEVVDCNKEMKDMMNNLIVKYPYCPIVRLEESLFYSDILHDFKKSANAFLIYKKLAEGKASVSKQLYIDFLNLFPVSKPFSESLNFQKELEEKKKNSSDLVFISLNDTQEDATRCILPPFQDKFYSLCQAFSIPKHKPTFEINFDKIRLNSYKYVFISSIIAFILMLGVTFEFIEKIGRKANLYETRLRYIQETLNFRYFTFVCYMNSMVMYNFKNNSYNLSFDYEDFMKFVIKQIQETCDSMLEYNNLMSTESAITNNINTYLPNCSTTDCSFSYIFGYMHNIAFYYSRNEQVINDIPEYSLNKLTSSVDMMIQLIDNIYNQFAQNHCNSIHDLTDFVRIYIISLICFESIGFIAFILLFELIGKNLYKNLFAIINTVPNSVLKEVASMFKKVEIFIGFVKRSPQKVFTRKMMPLLFSLSIFLIFIYPVFIGIIILIYKNDIYEYNNLSNLSIFSTTESNILIIYVQEYLLYSNYISMKNNITKIEDFFAQAEKVWKSKFIDADLYIPAIKLMIIITSPISRTICYILPILSILLFLAYIIQGLESLRLFTTMHQLMRYIPQRAWNANPVLKVLTKGVVVPVEKVEQLREDLLQSNFSQVFDLCSIQLSKDSPCIENTENSLTGSGNVLTNDESGYFVEVKGNIDRFFGFHPLNLKEIIQCLINQMPEAENQIKQFFLNRPDQPVSATFDGKTEVKISFSKGNKNLLFISDNNSHFLMNSLIRKMQLIKYTVQFKSEEIKNPFVAIIDNLQYQNLRNSLNVEDKNLNDFLGFEVRDRRNKILIIDKVNNVELQKRVISLLKPLLHSFEGRCSICNEGSLYILGSKIMFPPFKGRVFGSCYDTALQALNNLNPGQIAFPSSLMTDKSTNPFIFKGSNLSISIIVT